MFVIQAFVMQIANNFHEMVLKIVMNTIAKPHVKRLTVSNLTSPRFEPQTYRCRDKRITARLTER